MENTEIKSGAKVVRNKIVLKNLTRKQKQILSTVGVIAGGVGLGTGLFTLYSMTDPHVIPGLQTNLGSDDADPKDVNTLQEARSESIVLHTKNPILEVQDGNIPFSEAFKSAREINGSGSWFIWKGNIYNTFFKEEWQAMPSSEKDEYLASLSIPNEKEDLTDIGSAEHSPSVMTSELADVDDSANQVVENPEIRAEHVASETSLIPDEFTLDFINMEAREPEILIDNTQLPIIAEQPAMGNLVEGEFISLEDDTDLKHEDIFELHDDVEISLITEEDIKNLDSVVIDSDQIVDFPWNGPVEIIKDEIPDATQVIVGDSQEGIQEVELPHPIGGSSQLEETPWGETIESASDQDAGSLSEIFQKVEQTEGKLVSNPEEITEYPWGESISSEPTVVVSTDSGVIIDELPLVEGHTQPLAGFDDVEEFPWGEQNVHFNPETISTNTETIGELLLPETGIEHENVGIIVGDISEPVFYSQLPSSFSDITEFPWGESILNQPLGQNTGVYDFTDTPIDHHIDHTSIDGAE